MLHTKQHKHQLHLTTHPIRKTSAHQAQGKQRWYMRAGNDAFYGSTGGGGRHRWIFEQHHTTKRTSHTKPKKFIDRCCGSTSTAPTTQRHNIPQHIAPPVLSPVPSNTHASAPVSSTHARAPSPSPPSTNIASTTVSFCLLLLYRCTVRVVELKRPYPLRVRPFNAVDFTSYITHSFSAPDPSYFHLTLHTSTRTHHTAYNQSSIGTPVHASFHGVGGPTHGIPHPPNCSSTSSSAHKTVRPKPPAVSIPVSSVGSRSHIMPPLPLP
ncbi:unnamed protein product [Ectocarpus sp. 12 AP-2014]